LYPALFGQRLLPLKRGMLQDLLAAHPEDLAKDELKTALGLHTRSTRYLTAMASGQPRHDLSGVAVEAVAPEHQHHALVEVFKRRQQRTEQNLKPELRQRMLQAADASGLAPLDYAQLVRTGNEEANALLDDAMGELSAHLAKDQALLQAFEASGETVTAFADAHGMHPIEAAATLNRARARRVAPAA
jgi:sRNA-binding protein